MVAPLSLVFMCNLTFLVITVVSIHRVNTLLTFDAMKKEQYQNLILYVKLSSVTSVYWIVTIVAEAVDSDVLRIISILLNGLQGVSIFISYTCNKKVYQLYFKTPLHDSSST
nr:adhesion G protein-coupled receptor E3-like [Biomphalaria glabrata]